MRIPTAVPRHGREDRAAGRRAAERHDVPGAHHARNLEGLLKPGMNGEVSVLIDRRDDVLAVPNDAIRNVREAATAAPMLGLDPDWVQAQIRAQWRHGWRRLAA